MGFVMFVSLFVADSAGRDGVPCFDLGFDLGFAGWG